MKDSLRTRQYYIFGLFAFSGLLLVGRLAKMQLFDTSYSNRANAVTIARQYIYPSRGLIYDRNGKILINNDPVYDLKVIQKEINPKMDTSFFCKILGITKSYFDEKMDMDWSDPRFSKSMPYAFTENISPSVYARLQEVLFEYPGFYIQQKNRRTYPFPYAANILGYISEVNDKQIEDSNGQYTSGDEIGISGIEKYFEKQLRGRRGIHYELKNNIGRSIGSYKNGSFDVDAQAGKDLISSIDIDLQGFSEELMKNKIGSVVAIDPKTGEILAMVSSPSYDPNLLVMDKDRGKAFQALLQDTLKPFFNRSIMAKYPPGSIFKTLVSLIALEEGLTWPSRYIPCNGAYYYGSIKWGCHHHAACTTLPLALQHSCNTYFFQLTRDIIDQYSFHLPGKGLNAFAEHLYDFGLGAPMGIDYPSEKGGNIPSATYYDKLYKKRRGWRSPTIMSIGIGQGEIQLTTLQMANVAAIIANRGSYFIPHLIRGYKEPGYKIEDKFSVKHNVKINPAHFAPVIDGMERVVLFGTGRRAAVAGISIAGKTGTSQNPHGEDHSIFFGFAPVDHPAIAVAVIVENAGKGAEFAAPIASLVMEKYIRKSITRPELFNQMQAINTLHIRPKQRKYFPSSSILMDSTQSTEVEEIPDPFTQNHNQQ